MNAYTLSTGLPYWLDIQGSVLRLPESTLGLSHTVSRPGKVLGVGTEASYLHPCREDSCVKDVTEGVDTGLRVSERVRFSQTPPSVLSTGVFGARGVCEPGPSHRHGLSEVCLESEAQMCVTEIMRYLRPLDGRGWSKCPRP